MAEGWPECFGLHTIDVIRYAWQSRPFHQERVREIIATAPPSLRIQRLGSGRQVRRFLSRRAGAAQGPGLLVPQDLQALPRPPAAAGRIYNFIMRRKTTVF